MTADDDELEPLPGQELAETGLDDLLTDTSSDAADDERGETDAG